jgi:hypothetical protein
VGADEGAGDGDYALHQPRDSEGAGEHGEGNGEGREDAGEESPLAKMDKIGPNKRIVEGYFRKTHRRSEL